jgi:hypothetical protein
MNKIIFAAALLAVLMVTLAIGVTSAAQQVKAVVDSTCADRGNTIEHCLMKDLTDTLQSAIGGIAESAQNPGAK